MADVKISQLPVATTPVDGTEVLPIVQSATTKQVSIANLTAGRAMSASSLTLTTPLAVTSGGTGIATAAQGSLLSATGADTFSATRTPTLGLAGTAAGTLGLSGSTSGVVTLATAATAGTWTFTLPTSGGTNGFILTTNGSGVTTWTNPTALGVDLDVGTTAITGGTTGRVLYNNAGVLGEYSSVPVSFGGTGLTSLTAGYIPYGNGTGAFSNSANLTFDGTSLTLGATSARIIADMSNSTIANRLTFQTSTTNGNTNVSAIPNGTSTTAWFKAYSNYDPTNASMAVFGTTGSDVRIASDITGTGTYLPILFLTSGNERLRIDTSGNVGIGTSSPTARLDVSTSGTYIQNLNGPSGVFTRLGTSSSSFYTVHNGSTDTFLYTQESSPLRFGTAATERMRIDSSGNVGIGALSGGQRLLVQTNLTGTTPRSNTVTRLQSNGAGYDANLQFSDNVANSAEVGMVSGNLYFCTAGTERARIDASGNLLVGTTSSTVTANVGIRLFGSFGDISATRSESADTATTFVAYSTGASAYRFYVGMGGTVYATNTTITAISDRRLKENIVDLDVGLDALLTLKPRKFDWKAGKGKDIKGDRGWIADEFQQVFPDLIDTWKDEPPVGEEPYKAVRADLMPVVVKAIQELAAKVSALEAKQ